VRQRARLSGERWRGGSGRAGGSVMRCPSVGAGPERGVQREGQPLGATCRFRAVRRCSQSARNGSRAGETRVSSGRKPPGGSAVRRKDRPRLRRRSPSSGIARLGVPARWVVPLVGGRDPGFVRRQAYALGFGRRMAAEERCSMADSARDGRNDDDNERGEPARPEGGRCLGCHGSRR
jgi:hypothetical protein